MAEPPSSRARGDRRAGHFRGLAEVSRALTYATTHDEVLALGVVRSLEILGADASMIMLIEEADQELVTVRSRVGALGRPLERLREREQDPLGVDLAARLGCEPGRCVLAVPLVVGGAVTGILAVAPATEAPSSAREEEEWLLSAVADQVAVAVEKMRLDEVASFRERLIGIVSHDLRTPVSAILLSAQRLAAVPNLPAKAQAMVERISRSATRAEHMIRDLLDFTQIRLAGALHLSPQKADLADIAVDAVDEVRHGLADGRIRIDQHGPTAGLFDADRMAQLVGNLLANALTHGDAARPISVRVEGEAEQVCLKVHNFGRPIPQGSLSQIFEPMHQASASRRPPGGGLGLGLFICRHIAEAHGGTIDVTSAPEAGTTFRVRLPRQAAAA